MSNAETVFYSNLTIFVLFTFLYSITSGRLARTPFSGAIIFMTFGLAFGPFGLNLLHLNVEAEALRTLAEVTLALVLFTDAATADLDVLRKNFRIPERLLLIGLPLTILFGFALAILLFHDLLLLELIILATILAPTDAALGAAVVTDRQVPAPVREGLNIESGLNDGICVPIMLTFLAIATSTDMSNAPMALAVKLVLQEIGIGLLVGMTLTFAGGWLLRFCILRDWVNAAWLQVIVIAMALACFTVAQLAGGSGFIAAFCGGLLFGGLVKRHKERYLLAGEGAGDILALITWVVFGCGVAGQTFHNFGWPSIVYAVLSLTVIRMLPVYLALAGTDLQQAEKVFIGWFGPRGLATIVFAVMVLNSTLPHRETLGIVAVCTVMLSIVAHGMSARSCISILRKRTGG